MLKRPTNRDSQRGEMRQTHTALALGPPSPAGLLCATWRGDVFRPDGSKRPRAHCENSKAKRASDDLEAILVQSFPVF